MMSPYDGQKIKPKGVTEIPKQGEIYSVIVGMSITPRLSKVLVVWVNDDTVWYRLAKHDGGFWQTPQNTALDRFMAIVEERIER